MKIDDYGIEVGLNNSNARLDTPALYEMRYNDLSNPICVLYHGGELIFIEKSIQAEHILVQYDDGSTVLLHLAGASVGESLDRSLKDIIKENEERLEGFKKFSSMLGQVKDDR